MENDENTTNLWVHVIENTEHSSLLGNWGDVTKVVGPLDFAVPESVRKLKRNLYKVTLSEFNIFSESSPVLLLLDSEGDLPPSSCILYYYFNHHITFSMIPAPRLWMAFSFLSGSGGLN